MLEEIISMIAEQLDIPKESITAESRLLEDLKADSMDVIGLVMDLEQKYNTTIPDDDLPKIRTVGDIVTFVSKK